MTFKCIESLEENSVELYLEVSSILLKLIDNVLHYPSNPKYRKLRLENKVISNNIIPAIGAMECLFEIGFQEGDDALFLPPETTCIKKLTQFREELANRRNQFIKEKRTLPNGNVTQANLSSNVTHQSNPQSEVATQFKITAPVSTNTSLPENAFLAKIHIMSSMVLQYEEESTKQKALSVVPWADINKRVENQMRQYQKEAYKSREPLNESSLQETLFFMELMAWFKNDFFDWVNNPKCNKCNSESQFLEMSSDPVELIESHRVEVYKCQNCSARVLFPRINNVIKLMDTRKGRCGEWANTFTALCRAIGWEARYVYDETDHVWTEIFFKSEGRWVHCDVCECALDKPLMYEKGWGKQLSYIIAFSCEDVQDVTWRYSANHAKLLDRRKQCSEQSLLQTIRQLNTIRQMKLSDARRKMLAKRTVIELIQLMQPAKDTEGDDQGRKSGSLSWRLARHETTLPECVNTSYVWTPTQQEVEVKKMAISYCAGTDEYFREQNGESIKGWKNGVMSAENIFRKEEKDWKMTYLCRTERSTEGNVIWQVDVSSCGLLIDQVEVTCSSTSYENGRVLWQVCSGDKCSLVNDGRLKTSEFEGSSVITVKASLSGGKGDVAWQHAQLFRQPTNTSEPAFQLNITLKTN